MSRMGELSQSPRRKRFCKHKSYALHIYTYARQNENKYIGEKPDCHKSRVMLTILFVKWSRRHWKTTTISDPIYLYMTKYYVAVLLRRPKILSVVARH